jgi:hypothetical protein
LEKKKITGSRRKYAADRALRAEAMATRLPVRPRSAIRGRLTSYEVELTEAGRVVRSRELVEAWA